MRNKFLLQDQLKAVRELALAAGFNSAAEWIVSMSGKTFSEDLPKDCGYTLATCPYERCSGITQRSLLAELEALLVSGAGMQNVALSRIAEIVGRHRIPLTGCRDQED